MAGRFTDQQWDAIEAELARHPSRYGLPEGGREESLILASFNIRKLGKSKNRERELAFMARFCARCDLVAIQEVQDDLTGLRYLQDRVAERVASAGEYGLVVSDTTGEVPGDKGMAERLAFLYRRSRIRRLDMTSDLTIDRTGMLKRLFDNQEEVRAAWDKFQEKMRRHERKELKKKPIFATPVFMSFTRTPHVAAFEVPATEQGESISFIAVNAHLIYGKPAERKDEFKALVRWMAMRLRAEKRMIAPNFVLMGDLNLDFDDPDKDRKDIEDFTRTLNAEAFGDRAIRRIYFPFIDDHPATGQPLRTNARHNQTFDQIAFFRGEAERRLPNDRWRGLIDRNDPDSFDYGVFDFAELFAHVIRDREYGSFSPDERKEFGRKFEHKVSDHMPIWVRIPRPGFHPPPGV